MVQWETRQRFEEVEAEPSRSGSLDIAARRSHRRSVRLPILAVVAISCAAPSPPPPVAPAPIAPVAPATPVAPEPGTSTTIGPTASSMNFYPPDPAVPGGPWALQISVVGTGFVARGLPLGARVGDVPVEAIIEIGNQFTGYLAKLPPDGSELSIGYEVLSPTGLRYHR
jgi:hypothetical protein